MQHGVAAAVLVQSKKLCDLIKSNQSNIPDVILQGLIDRIFRADRLLASLAIQEAIAAGASRKKIEQAQKHLTKGDARVEEIKTIYGIKTDRLQAGDDFEVAGEW